MVVEKWLVITWSCQGNNPGDNESLKDLIIFDNDKWIAFTCIVDHKNNIQMFSSLDYQI